MRQLALIINGKNITVPNGIPNGGFDTSGMNIINLAMTMLFVLAEIAALVFVVYAGIQWAMSGGDKQKIQSARNRLMYSIIGLIVITLSLFIVHAIIDLLFNPGSPGRLGGP